VVPELDGTWDLGIKIAAPSGAASNPDVQLQSVACSSVSTCVAVGNYTNANGVLAMSVNRTNGSWNNAVPALLPSNANSDLPSVLYGDVCTSATFCVAVGQYEASVLQATEALAMIESTTAEIPSAPSLEKATNGSSEVKFSFTPPVTDGGAAIKLYEYSLNGGKSWSENNLVVSKKVITIAKLKAKTRYMIELRAVNVIGPGFPSNLVKLTTT
jgi:hypothetical protein